MTFFVPRDKRGVLCHVFGTKDLRSEFFKPFGHYFNLLRFILAADAKSDWVFFAECLPRKVFTISLVKDEVATIDINWKVNLVFS